MQISYDSLEDDTVKNLLLHVACFFVGEEEDYVVKILDHCGLHATVGIQNLIDRCLITRYMGKLMMHQVIQDMGREIVRQESPNQPGKRSRLWYHEDSFSVLKYDKGTEAIQGLILDGQKINKVESGGSSFGAAEANPHLIMKLLGYVKKKKKKVHDRFLPSKEGDLKIDAFTKMVNLKLVKLNHVHLRGHCNKFPKELRWICWHGFPLEYVPMELPQQNLVALDAKHSLLKQVWKGYMEVKSLKFLNLSYSLELRQTPDFRGLLQLERLILRGCSNLVKVCKTIGILKGLVSLDLRDCKSLRDLPGLPESIVTLDLSGCHLGEFPREQKNVEPFDGYGIVKFASPSMGTAPIKLLAYLPNFLVMLSLEDCNLSDECFPSDFGWLSSLECLDLSGNLITRLPDCVRNLSNSRLRWLNMTDCPQLQSVIHPPSTVTHLHLENNRQLGRTKVRLINTKGYSMIYVVQPIGYVEIEGCYKWVHAQNVDRKIIKSLGLKSVQIGWVGKVLYEFGIFSTCVKRTRVPRFFCSFPDGELESEEGEEESEDGGEDWEEVPCRINIPFEKKGAKIAYTIPCSSIANNKVQGLNIRLAIRQYVPWCYNAVLAIDFTVHDKTKDLVWTHIVSLSLVQTWVDSVFLLCGVMEP